MGTTGHTRISFTLHFLPCLFPSVLYLYLHFEIFSGIFLLLFSALSAGRTTANIMSFFTNFNPKDFMSIMQRWSNVATEKGLVSGLPRISWRDWI